MDNEVKSIGVQEFVRRFKRLMEDSDAKFCFFLGAGCSVSSGIPAIGNLVDNVWLPKLKELETGNRENFNEWLRRRFPEYKKENAAQFYEELMENLFPTPKERQKGNRKTGCKKRTWLWIYHFSPVNSRKIWRSLQYNSHHQL